MSQRHQNQGNRGNQSGQNQQSEILEIVNQIKNSRSLSDILRPEKFAPVGGWADKIAKELVGSENKSDSINMSQLRKLFTQIKKVCDEKNIEDKTGIYLIYPLLAYTRARKLIPQKFYTLLVELLNKLKESKEKKDFDALNNFMTALVAYFKYYSEK